ncbi:MAG: succinate dehydrogenase, hydrophobic membrane anchor protein, partial [Gammaproteobacteria bacterium]
MRLFSLLAVLAMAAHAWIGLWAVLTDYVTVRLMGPRATVLRLLLQVGMVGALLAYVIWAVDILWRG